MRPAARSTGWPAVVRALHLAHAMAVAALGFVREVLRPEASREERLPRAAGRALVGLYTTLGATLIKVGQIASTRTDVLPHALALVAFVVSARRRGLANLQVTAEVGRIFDILRLPADA